MHMDDKKAKQNKSSRTEFAPETNDAKKSATSGNSTSNTTGTTDCR